MSCSVTFKNLCIGKRNPPYNFSKRKSGGFFILEEKAVEKRVHKLELRSRSKGSITGVSDVLCFDEEEIRLVTDLGILSVKGKELHVTRLDLEKQEVDLEGKVDSLIYSQARGENIAGKEGMLKRFFK